MTIEQMRAWLPIVGWVAASIAYLWFFVAARRRLVNDGESWEDVPHIAVALSITGFWLAIVLVLASEDALARLLAAYGSEVLDG